MTYSELYISAKMQFTKAGVLSPAFDALCLFEHFFKVGRAELVNKGRETPDPEALQAFLNAIEERENGRPLQYIIGSWNFMGITFHVREGVLVPRDDTEVVVNECLSRMEGIENPAMLDLCAGSGAVSIALSKFIKGGSVTAVELHKGAYDCLCENIAFNKAMNVTAVKGDVFTSFPEFVSGAYDLIVSNPPYIPTQEIETLRKEVRREPAAALDGGSDGMDFYRAIAKDWSRCLKPLGVLAFELGEGQSGYVSALLKSHGFTDIVKKKDLGGEFRAISAVFNP